MDMDTYHIYACKSISPFIITQIGELQNEFILASNDMLAIKDTISDILYIGLEFRKSHTSFLRSFIYENNVYIVNIFSYLFTHFRRFITTINFDFIFFYEDFYIMRF